MSGSESGWDVIVVGAGPAGLAAAHAAAGAGAHTLVVERAQHPRYKTCGGGLIGVSLASMPPGVAIPVRERIRRVSFTHDGRREFTLCATPRGTRRQPGDGGAGATPLVTMVSRAELDDELRRAAVAAGATVRQRSTVRALVQHDTQVSVRLAGGEELAAQFVVGADGSSGCTARHVGVDYDQVDLGLELELPVDEQVSCMWRERVLVDWGPIPGSYGWVFPKGDSLTVGVIAARGHGEATRHYLRRFVERLGLAGIEPTHDTGHLTRCRSEHSPLSRGRVIVAGDAAGLLEPWTREGISFALRSGALAGAAAASGDLDSYGAAVVATLSPTMRAGRQFLRAYTRHPALFHAALGSRAGRHMFSRFCQGDGDFGPMAQRRLARAVLALFR